MNIADRISRFLERNTEASLFEIKESGKYAITMKYHDFISLPKGTKININESNHNIMLDFSKIDYDSLDTVNQELFDFFVSCWYQIPRKNTDSEKSEIDSFYWLSKAKNLFVFFGNTDKRIVENFGKKYSSLKSITA